MLSVVLNVATTRVEIAAAAAIAAVPVTLEKTAWLPRRWSTSRRAVAPGDIVALLIRHVTRSYRLLVYRVRESAQVTISALPIFCEELAGYCCSVARLRPAPLGGTIRKTTAAKWWSSNGGVQAVWRIFRLGGGVTGSCRCLKTSRARLCWWV